jgi:FixJ family two-component response regulator
MNVKMPRNLKTLTIAEKQMVLKVVKSGRKKKEIAEEFGIPGPQLIFLKGHIRNLKMFRGPLKFYVHIFNI